MSARTTLSSKSGITLIELILYTGLLITILSVLYELFSLAGVQKVREFVENELYANGQHALFEVQNTLKQATVVNEPVAGGASSDTLSIDGGSIVISVNEEGELIKTEGAVSEPLTGKYVIVDSFVVTQLGPSTESPTVEMEITLSARKQVEGRTRAETFTSSITLR